MAHPFQRMARAGVSRRSPTGLKPRTRGPRSKDPSNGKGTIPPIKVTTGGGLKKPVSAKRRKAVDYVIERQKKKGNILTRAQARKRVRANVKADKRNRSYAYDFAGDGAGTKDKDFGSKGNNAARRKAGYKHRNAKGADKFGTGSKFSGKPKKDTKPPKVEKPKDDTSDDAGNGQSSDSYGGPQSLSIDRGETKKKRKKRKNRHGNG